MFNWSVVNCYKYSYFFYLRVQKLTQYDYNTYFLDKYYMSSTSTAETTVTNTDSSAPTSSTNQATDKTSTSATPTTSTTSTSSSASSSTENKGYNLSTSPTGNTEIDIYVYFDKVYTMVTVLFAIIVLAVPYEYSWMVFGIYVISMILIYLKRNGVFDVLAWMRGEVTEEKKDNITEKNEVFHVANQELDYLNAQSVCKAYGARLATYKELEDAYNNGADWCTYGWSEGQNAFFPTQQSTFDQLQKIKGHEQDCGRPGINGGFVSDVNFQFGANCYGKKPSMTESDKILMDATTPYPKTEQDLELEQQVANWKKKLPELLVSPFNRSSWDEPYLRV